ncbi:hypothetical protein VD0002_g5961 [Verticillium dahliae]|uniref:Sister chromatid cohesion protein PDS5 n=1 Tax=Verticillium dahliae TaxID=27337 RepID=A0AA45AQ05_VERDA|nr:hypothetical protein VdG2_06066 [Verticillium dahliae VDG2]PNH35143.1 hypothetical protein BJF96_g1747 [Verticillium dahliae]PNH40246.1 hypothetical protein VD0003_g10112 [Verticillium dahliae]PNH61954.1 hypothetical protein VD0002_g5961 [Verticillium dahliae]
MARASRRRGRAEPEPEPEPEVVEEVEEVEEIQEETPEAEAEDDEEEEAAGTQDQVEHADSENDNEAAQSGEVFSLQFDEELTWRVGRPIAVSTLLKRLEKLSEELGTLEQDHVDLESLSHVCEALGQRNLLAHKDQGVRAYTASCIADILQLSAPNAPFTPDQLQMFFDLVIKDVFTHLGDQSHPYHKQHKYVLASLNDTQSILLINDVDGADNLLQRMFSSFFDTASSTTHDDGVSKDNARRMSEMLITLIEESSGISPKIIELIMAQFLRAAPPGGASSRPERDNSSQSTLLLKSEPLAYVMAKEICMQCSEKMVHYVSQYFSDVIIDASRFAAKSNGHRHGGDNEDDDTPRGPTDSEVRELRKAHLLIKELWRAAPSVLQNVIPQVEAELSADNVELRQIATETLGDMISGIGAAGPPPVPVLDPAAYPPLRLADEDPSQVSLSILTTPLSPQSFAQTHHTAYTSFIGRSRDKTPAIRAAWTTAVGYILSTSAGGIGLSREEQAELVRALAEKLGDGDEKVRLAAVKTIELFGFRDFVLKLGSGSGSDKETPIIRSLLDRCRDKRPAIRVEAMTLLAKLWGVGAGELAAGQELVTTALKSIPSTIFNAWYANDLELNVLIDRVIFECLLPLSYPPTKTKGSKNTASQSQSVTSVPSEQDSLRTERILLLVQSLDAQARKAFFTMQARQPQFGQVLEAFIKQCEAYNGGVMDAEGPKRTAALERTIQYIGQFFPDPLKVKSDYMRFAKAHDRRNYQLIRFAISSQSDYKTVRGAIKELVKRMQNSPKGQDLATALDTLIPFLYRSACIIFNKSHLSAILESSKSNKESFGTIAHEILHEISARNPDMFKNFVGDLCEELVEQAPTEKKTNDPSTVDILRACSSFAKKYPAEIPDTQKFTRALQHYALYGRPVKASKYAIKIMLAKNDKQGQVTATAVFEKVMKQFEYGAPHFLNKLQVIAQLYLQAPKVVEEKDEEILDMAIQKIVRTTREEAVNDSSAPQWVEDANMSEELQAKLYSLRIAVNRIRSNEDQEEAKAQAVSVMKLLMTLVKKDGEISKTGNTPAHFRSRLRLLAGQLILKLCTLKHLDDTLNHKDFHTLAYLVQDAVLGVRKGFVEKLMKYLVLNRLRHRFYTIIFLTAYEPEPELKQHIETWIRSRVQSMAGNPQNPMEAILARLIPLLAHHPDYSTDPENLVDHAQYLIYYVSHVATEKNLGLIYKYAERVKQTRDNLDPEKSENLYVVSDLASAVIRRWQERRGWAFQAYPGKVGMPSGIYVGLTDHDTAQAIATKQYIPDGMDNRIDTLLKAVDKKKKRKSGDERGDGAPAVKKVRTKEPKPASARPIAAPKRKSAAKAKAKPKRPSKAAGRASSPVVDEANRRRSGRSRKTESKYTERDSDEDDNEMLEDGVAEWDYGSGSGDDHDDEVEDDGEEEQDNDKAPEASDSEMSDAASNTDHEEDEAPANPAKTKSPAQSRKSAAAAAKRDSSVLSDPASSDLSEPEESDDEKDATPPPAKPNGRKARGAAKTAELPRRPAAKKEAAPAARPTRSRRSRAAKSDDMDVDSE